jgi:hypothetical protein
LAFHLDERLARREKFTFKFPELYAAKVRSPVLFAASYDRCNSSRATSRWFAHGST